MPMPRLRGGCARAASGHAAAEPAITLMNSRRLIPSPRGRGSNVRFPLWVTSAHCTARMKCLLRATSPEKSRASCYTVPNSMFVWESRLRGATVVRTNNLKVLIAGGGIGGLTALLALRARGIEAQLFEQAEAFRQVGAGIQLSS